MRRAILVVAALCALTTVAYDIYLKGQLDGAACIDHMTPDEPESTEQPSLPSWWHHRPAHREALPAATTTHASHDQQHHTRTRQRDTLTPQQAQAKGWGLASVSPERNARARRSPLGDPATRASACTQALGQRRATNRDGMAGLSQS